MKKFLAILAISSLLWSSVIMPAKAWVLPVLARAGVYVMDKVAALSTAQKINYGASVAVHAVVASLVLTDDDQPPAADGSNTTIQIQLDPNTPLIKPVSAATQPATVAATPVVEVVSDEQVSYYRNSTNCTGTAAYPTKTAMGEAIISQCVGIGSSWPVSINIIDSPPPYITFNRNTTGTVSYLYSISNSCAPGSTWNGSDCVQTVYTCPPNYTLSGQTCNSTMTEPLDNKVRIKRTDNTFAKDPDDPDPLPDNVTITGGNTVTAKTCGFDAAHPCPSNIPPKTVQVRADINGTVSIISAQPTANSNTEVKGVTLSAPAGENNPPVVIGTSEALIPGTGGTIGELDDATPAADGTNVLNLPGNLATTEKQCGYDEAHPCITEFVETGVPSEVAGTHLTDLDTKYDELNAMVAGQTAGVGDGIAHPLATNFDTGECTNPTFDASNVHPNAVVAVPICEHITELQPFLRFAAYFGTALLIYGVWFRRQGGTD